MTDKPAGEKMPATIGRYQIQDNIGFGAMGAVYKAFDPLIKRTLAIKTIRLDIPKQSAQYQSFIERFYHEARISGTLSHPNIVTLFDIGEEHGIPYLAMEYVPGDTVSAILEKGLPFAAERVVSIVSQVASALDYAHGRGVVHRDIKPSNVILHEGDKVKVTDFGIAKLANADMTQSGTLLGTPSYMSPEQAMGEKVDGRSDIFSLGVCAFEMLSGQQPFPGSNVTSILYRLVHDDPVVPPDLETHGLVPEKWREVFSKVLAKQPGNRYESAGAFVADLELCMGAWFGSLSEQTAAGATLDNAATLQKAVPASDTTPLKADPSIPLPPPQPSSEPQPTMTLGAVTPVKAPAPDAHATMAMATPSPPEPPPFGPTVALPRPSPPAEQPPTMNLPPPAPAQKTMVTPPVSPSEERTIVTPALPRAEEKTVVTPVPTFAEGGAPSASPASVPRTGPVQAGSPSGQSKAPRRSALPLVVLGLLAVGLLAGVGLLFARRSAAPPTTPEATPPPVVEATPVPEPTAVAPVLGSLRVESQPAGAAITVNGEARGTTPVDIADLPLGDYQLRLDMRGFESKTETAHLTADAPRTELLMKLTRRSPITASIDITSTPLGATVSLDGGVIGRTPILDLKLRPGDHRVEVSGDGYEPYTTAIRVAAGKKASVDATLRQATAVREATPGPTAAPIPVLDLSRVFAPEEVDPRPARIGGLTASYPSGKLPRLKAGQSVSVTVAYVISETGEVTDPKVTESGGVVLDDEVLKAVRSFRYTPGQKSGRPVKVRMSFKQTFRGGS